MFGRSRKGSPTASGVAPRATVDVAPWEGMNLTAEWAMLPVPPRTREQPSVVLTSGAARHQLHKVEVLKLVEHKIGIAESIDLPTAFFCWPEAAAKTSPAYDLIGELPREALALLVEPMDAGIAAVVEGDELKSFTQWVLSLPH